MDPSRCKDKDKEADPCKEKRRTKIKIHVDPNKCTYYHYLLRKKIFCLEAKNMNFAQEQSQEEDAKDCTGQISKPVSCQEFPRRRLTKDNMKIKNSPKIT